MKWSPRIALGAMLAASACETADGSLPASYRDTPVPAERLRSAGAREQGRRLFLEHCALCHGEAADGRGVRREGLSRPPADFTSPLWRQRMTPRRAYFVIREGVRGSPMPSWKALDSDDTWDLVAYLLSLTEPVGSRDAFTDRRGSDE